MYEWNDFVYSGGEGLGEDETGLTFLRACRTAPPHPRHELRRNPSMYQEILHYSRKCSNIKGTHIYIYIYIHMYVCMYVCM